MMGRRSGTCFVRSEVDVKTWLVALPSVHSARPERCPFCDGAGAPVGKGLGIWGHGVRERQVQGPAAIGEASGIAVLRLRRYLCRGCGAVLVVGPRGLLTGRLYGAAAVALALALWAIDGRSAREVRQAVAPGVVEREEVRSWASLRRWAQAAATGQLWSRLRVALVAGAKAQAREVAAGLGAFAPPDDRHRSSAARSWSGALHAM